MNRGKKLVVGAFTMGLSVGGLSVAMTGCGGGQQAAQAEKKCGGDKKCGGEKSADKKCTKCAGECKCGG